MVSCKMHMCLCAHIGNDDLKAEEMEGMALYEHSPTPLFGELVTKSSVLLALIDTKQSILAVPGIPNN